MDDQDKLTIHPPGSSNDESSRDLMYPVIRSEQELAFMRVAGVVPDSETQLPSAATTPQD